MLLFPVTFTPALPRASGKGYVVFLWKTNSTDLTKFSIKPNGLADLDARGGWSEGDIGADAANCGAR